MRFVLQHINHDFASFNSLVHLYAEAKELLLDNIEIDMEETLWFDADMCAVFGAILCSLGDRPNDVNLIHIPPSVEEILSKNGFLSHYGGMEIPDWWGTTIPYQRFKINGARIFYDYIQKKFIRRAEIPEMSRELSRKFCNSIYEIFYNSVSHSCTELGIFSCGQFFPKRKQLVFTVADLGIGIRAKLENYIGREILPEQAINWATKEGNSTKQDNLLGGCGLKLLCDFISKNKGCIQIVSDAGYWQQKDSRIETGRLDYPFPGTVVRIEINTLDRNYYWLTSELNPENIF